MTGMPEASVARELAMCFTTVCLVTDHDAGVDGGEAVTHTEVLAQFSANIERMKALLTRTIAAMPAQRTGLVGNLRVPQGTGRTVPAVRAALTCAVHATGGPAGPH